MKLIGTGIIIYFSILLICMATVTAKCPEDMLDCCGICYYPDFERCVNLGHDECKIVETSESKIPYPKPQNTVTTGENICDLIDDGKIIVETAGSGISNLRLKIKPKIDLNLEVSIPAGTFFSAKRGSSQNMVSTKGITVKLTAEPGIDIELEEDGGRSDQKWTYVDIPVACANMHKDVPSSSDTFEIERSPNQEELEKLSTVLDAEGPSYPIRQAAIWIITDNADYNDLGTLISKSPYSFGGSRMIKEYEAAEAMRLIDESGINIEEKAIWEDRDVILDGLTDQVLRRWMLHKIN